MGVLLGGRGHAAWRVPLAGVACACNALSGVGDYEVVPSTTSTAAGETSAGGATSSAGKGGGSGTGGDAAATTATGTASGAGMGGAGANGGGGSGGTGGGPPGCMKHADCPSEACLGGSCATIVQVAAGATFACAVLGDGTAHCWGRNHDGQLGDGTATPHHKPKPVLGLSDVVEIAVSRSAGDENPDVHACARLANGKIKCWGDNGNGQLATGTQGPDKPTPQPVLGNLSFSRVAVGSEHTCAVAVGGDLWCAGKDSSGQVGDGGANEKVLIPAKVLTGVTDVTAGDAFTCALKKVRTVQSVWCWGSNGKKQLGILAPTMASSSVPVEVPGVSGAVAIAAGRDFACATKAPNEVWCWGDNSDAQITTMPGGEIAPPVVAMKLVQISLLSLGVDRDGFNDGGHGCAVHTFGFASCWGENTSGQVGDGTSGNKVPLPAGLMSLGSVKAISAGADFTCAITAAGALRCWGRNDEGQLGIGVQTGNEPLPLPVVWP
jgi:alpha-tubulin suppressor-like RCC1 family protein